MMKRQWGLTILILLLAIVFVSGCAKKTVLKEEAAPKEQAARAETKPAVKVPEKNTVKADAEAKKSAERERAEREATLKAQTQKEAEIKKKAAEKAAAAVAAEKLYELTDINFDFDKFNLNDEAREMLKKHAAWLSKNRDAMIVVEGHCDERGTAEYNLALGQRRAISVAKFLTDMAIDEKRIKTISYGSERPLDPLHNEEAWTKNRRAHVVISRTK